MASRHILVVDDEARIREVVQYALQQAGYRVTVAGDADRALQCASERDVDLVVLDIMLPDDDGLSLCQKLRSKAGPVPVVFLSARSEEIDRVVGLEVGGDDYLTKPFSPRELVARVKAVLRRASGQAGGEAAAAASEDAVLEVGRLRIDLERHSVAVDGAPIELTATEFTMLVALYRRPGVVLSRTQLMDEAHGLDTRVTDRTVDSHVRRIRGKFRSHSINPVLTVHGVGYKSGDPA